MVQKSVAQYQVLGVPGEFADDSPHRCAPYSCLANNGVAPTVARAFTQGTADNEAIVGGTGAFLGVLVEPKQYANYANLNASMEVNAGTNGEICDMGHIYLKSATAFAPGYLAEYEPATGVISAIEDTLSSATAVQVPNARFIKISGSANSVGILELGAFGVPAAKAYS